MFRSYIRIAVRSFRQSTGYQLAGLAGLAVGLCAALMIFYYASSQFSYDRWLDSEQTIFRLDTAETYPGRKPLDIARAPGPVAAALQAQVPEIEDITRGFADEVQVRHEQQLFAEDGLVVDNNFLKFFDFPLVAGDAELALDGPESVAISEELAARYFGNSNPLGQLLVIEKGKGKAYTVSAVFRDLPENTHFRFDVLLPVEGYFSSREAARIRDFWGGAYFHTYMKLQAGATPQSVENQLPDFTDRNFPDDLAKVISSAPHDFFRFRLVALQDIHLHGAPLATMKEGGDIDAIMTLAVVAALVVFAAVINFSIMTTAVATLRTREVALRKTLGATKGQVIVQFLGETLVQVLFVTLIAVAMSEFLMQLAEARYGSLFGSQSERDQLNLVWLPVLAGSATLMGGAYPALLLSGLRPASILDSSRAGILGADNVRFAMVVGQILIAICLVTVATTMVAQQRFLQSYALGFDPGPLHVISLPLRNTDHSRSNSLVTRLREVPGVGAVSLSSAVPTDASESNISVEIDGEAKPLQLGFHSIGKDFFKAYSVRPIAGRVPDTGAMDARQGEQDSNKAGGLVAINEAALASLRYRSSADSIGKVLRTSGGTEYIISAVVPDIRFRSLKEPVRPEIYLTRPAPGARLSVKLAESAGPESLQDMKTVWADVFPEYPFRMDSMNSLLANHYRADDRNAELLTAFAVTAMMLSGIGLASLIGFTILRQRRNLAIRRVFGAQTFQLIQNVGKKFMRAIVIANVVSWPVSLFFLQQWLEGFETRIELTIFPFWVALVLSVALASLLLVAHVGMLRTVRPAALLRTK